MSLKAIEKVFSQINAKLNSAIRKFFSLNREIKFRENSSLKVDEGGCIIVVGKKTIHKEIQSPHP